MGDRAIRMGAAVLLGLLAWLIALGWAALGIEIFEALLARSR